MVNFVDIFRTYEDVKGANPDWSDPMVEDYLSEKRNSSSLNDAFNELEDRVDYLEGTLVVTDVDITTEGNTTIICTAAVTISLTESPNDKDVVIIKQTEYAVTVNGNGRDIDTVGNSEVIMSTPTTVITSGLVFVYSSELDRWFVR